jgi:hypothetical protein
VGICSLKSEVFGLNAKWRAVISRAILRLPSGAYILNCFTAIRIASDLFSAIFAFTILSSILIVSSSKISWLRLAPSSLNGAPIFLPSPAVRLPPRPVLYSPFVSSVFMRVLLTYDYIHTLKACQAFACQYEQGRILDFLFWICYYVYAVITLPPSTQIPHFLLEKTTAFLLVVVFVFLSMLFTFTAWVFFPKKPAERARRAF